MEHPEGTIETCNKYKELRILRKKTQNAIKKIAVNLKNSGDSGLVRERNFERQKTASVNNRRGVCVCDRPKKGLVKCETFFCAHPFFQNSGATSVRIDNILILMECKAFSIFILHHLIFAVFYLLLIKAITIPSH